MPIVPQNRIDDLNNTLLTGSLHARRALLRETPIEPPHGDTSMFTVTQIKGAAHNFQTLSMGANVADKIRFIKLGNAQRFKGALSFITKKPSDLPGVNDRVGWIPCWFLPWSSARIIHFQILDVATDPNLNLGQGIAPIPNPDLFFTAGINGCSVFAQGSAKAPNLYHAGINPGDDLVIPGVGGTTTTEQAWRTLLGNMPANKKFGGIGKSDYVSELNAGATRDTDRLVYNGGKTTSLAKALEQTLEANGQITEVMVIPWGAVFGLRENGKWTMTLVRNSSVSYWRLNFKTKRKGLLRKKVQVQTGKHGEQLPKQAAATDGVLDMSRLGDLGEQKYEMCANLGYQDFFPGPGVAHNKNAANIQIY